MQNVTTKIFQSNRYMHLPDAVENITIRIDPDIQVGSEDVVKGSNFLISEEGIRHPHFAGICQCEILYPV